MSENSRDGTTHGYSVEARYNSTMGPKEINGRLLDTQWREVDFNRAEPGLGVPWGHGTDPIVSLLGLLGYAQAQALRWWFHANAQTGFFLETRIVKHAVKYSYESTRESEHLVVGGEDRSEVMPDLGVKAERSK